MRGFIVEACISIPIAFLLCYLVCGWPGVIGGVIGSIIGLGFVSIDYRRHIHANTH